MTKGHPGGDHHDPPFGSLIVTLIIPIKTTHKATPIKT